MVFANVCHPGHGPQVAEFCFGEQLPWHSVYEFLNRRHMLTAYATNVQCYVAPGVWVRGDFQGSLGSVGPAPPSAAPPGAARRPRTPAGARHSHLPCTRGAHVRTHVCGRRPSLKRSRLGTCPRGP